MWTEDNPPYDGWFLCAWKRGEGWIYAVGYWDKKKWHTKIGADPHMNQDIISPDAQFAMMDELAKNQKNKDNA
jgi:hypothetical protein